MTWRGRKYLDHPGPRHEPDWYDQSQDAIALAPGDRIFIRCQGGPCSQRLEIFPPRLEIDERDGLYALFDDGPRDNWFYLFVPNE